MYELDLTPRRVGPGTARKQGSPLRINKLFNACSATDESKRSPFFFPLFFLFRSQCQCQSCKLFLVMSIFAGLHFRFMFSFFFFFAWQWFCSFPAKKIKSEWITGEWMWACHSSSHDGSLKAGWRDVLRFFFFFFFPFLVQTSHHDRPSQAPFHSNHTCSGMII